MLCWGLRGSACVSRPQSGAKAANFKALQPFFASAGVPITQKDIRDIITEQRSSATKVLYLLRTALDGGAGKPRRSSKSPSRPVPEWKRESAADLVDDPELRSKLALRKAVEGGVSSPPVCVSPASSSQPRPRRAHREASC